MHQRDIVHEFFERCRIERPDEYRDVCAKYPTISGRQWKAIRKREVTVGLLGLQPARISPDVAANYGVENIHSSEE